MISFEDALDMILKQSVVLDKMDISIFDPLVLGTVLASDIVAQKSLPEFRASVVDGYAVKSLDGPGKYPLKAVSTAGEIRDIPIIHSGQIARVATGAAVPDGADAVVMVEDTNLTLSENGQEKIIEIKVKSEAGQFIRNVGSDIKKGEIILKKGHVISPADIGVIASIGMTFISVISKPRVSIFSSGNEIVEPSSSTSFGQIIDSNRPTLKCLLSKFGFPFLDMGIVLDNPTSIQDTIKESLEKSDILITTGGVSMGELDCIKTVLESLDAKIHFGRVSIKPGKPTTFATLIHKNKKKIIFALPGNPVSAYVTFHLFVLPCLHATAGNSTWQLPIVKAKVFIPILIK
jgi:gephyrin